MNEEHYKKGVQMFYEENCEENEWNEALSIFS